MVFDANCDVKLCRGTKTICLPDHYVMRQLECRITLCLFIDLPIFLLIFFFFIYLLLLLLLLLLVVLLVVLLLVEFFIIILVDFFATKI